MRHAGPKARARWVGSLLAFVAVLLLGVLAGFLWHATWRPVSGVAVQDTWIVHPSDAGQVFAATGGYVLWAGGLGLLAGWAVGRWVRPHLVAIAVAVVAGGLAGWLMALTGHLLGPPDPRPLAVGKADLTALPGDLRVEGWGPYLTFPASAVTALAASYILVSDLSRWRHIAA